MGRLLIGEINVFYAHVINQCKHAIDKVYCTNALREFSFRIVFFIFKCLVYRKEIASQPFLHGISSLLPVYRYFKMASILTTYISYE